MPFTLNKSTFLDGGPDESFWITIATGFSLFAVMLTILLKRKPKTYSATPSPIPIAEASKSPTELNEILDKTLKEFFPEKSTAAKQETKETKPAISASDLFSQVARKYGVLPLPGFEKLLPQLIHPEDVAKATAEIELGLNIGRQIFRNQFFPSNHFPTRTTPSKEYKPNSINTKKLELLTALAKELKLEIPKPPEQYKDSYISKEIYRDPVVAADGWTYEYDDIIKWFAESKGSKVWLSPHLNEHFTDFTLRANESLRLEISNNYLDKNLEELLRIKEERTKDEIAIRSSLRVS